MLFFFTIVAAVSLLPGCAAAGGPPPAHPARAAASHPAPGAPAKNTLSPGDPEAYAHFAAGVSDELSDKDDAALQQFDDAALADPSNESLVLELAQRYLRNRQPDRAVDLLSKSARRPDATEPVFSWLARAQLAAGQTNEAVLAGRKAVEKDPTTVDAYESLLEPYLAAKQLTDASRLLARAATAVDREPHSLTAVADLYTSYLRLAPKDKTARAKAIALLDAVSSQKFASPRLWQRVAELYLRLDAPKKAASVYEQLLGQAGEDAPEKQTYRQQLARIYLESDDKTNALRQLQALVRDDPMRYPSAWFALGEIAEQDGNFTDAVDDFQNAIRAKPDIEPAYYDLALAFSNLHRTADAEKILESAHTRFNSPFRYEFYSGLVEREATNYPAAIRHFSAAETVAKATSPNLLDKSFYFEIGAAYERNHQFKEATDYLQKAVDLDPSFAEALNYLGFMLADRGQQLDRARGLIERALKLEPQNGAYLDSMGWVLYKLNLPDQALPWMLKAVAANPEPDPTIFDHLGDVYFALRQTDKALDAWRKSIALDPNPEVKHKLDVNSRS